jgi:hypothetical protein
METNEQPAGAYSAAAAKCTWRRLPARRISSRNPLDFGDVLDGRALLRMIGIATAAGISSSINRRRRNIVSGLPVDRRTGVGG